MFKLGIPSSKFQSDQTNQNRIDTDTRSLFIKMILISMVLNSLIFIYQENMFSAHFQGLLGHYSVRVSQTYTAARIMFEREVK